MILASVLGMALMGREKFTGSDKATDHAQAKAGIIVVARLETFDMVFGIGACYFMGGGRLKVAEVLKGEARPGELPVPTVMASGDERLPRRDEELIYFLDDSAGHLKAVKVLPKTREDLEAVKKAIAAGKRP